VQACYLRQAVPLNATVWVPQRAVIDSAAAFHALLSR